MSPHVVCKLKEALYGLKQASRAWFDKFSHFLFSQGFKSSTANLPFFVLQKEDDFIVLLLYVDDMLITGNSSILFDDFLPQLKKEFTMKDLGQVHFFYWHSSRDYQIRDVSFTSEICKENFAKSKSHGLQTIAYSNGYKAASA